MTLFAIIVKWNDAVYRLRNC